jgi:hypothetical protein
MLGTALPFLCSGEDRFDIEIVLGSLVLANTPDFIDNGVPWH